jgi:hypothetical protein
VVELPGIDAWCEPGGWRRRERQRTGGEERDAVRTGNEILSGVGAGESVVICEVIDRVYGFGKEKFEE